MALGRLRIGRYPFWQVTKRGRAMGVQSREWLMGTPVAEVPPHDPGNFCTWDGSPLLTSTRCRTEQLPGWDRCKNCLDRLGAGIAWIASVLQLPGSTRRKSYIPEVLQSYFSIHTVTDDFGRSLEGFLPRVTKECPGHS